MLQNRYIIVKKIIFMDYFFINFNEIINPYLSITKPMDYLLKQYMRFTQYVLTNKNIYQIVCLGILVVILFTISNLTTSHKIEVWTSLFTGFTFGLFLICVPAIIAYYKKNKQGSAH
jgi:hypothetical protein